ncbi:MAG: DUF1491 family protein [Alphaproteobacteria bacterium]|nr:DUF1491 family protein [Alphaproteobacteria bacterium]
MSNGARALFKFAGLAHGAPMEARLKSGIWVQAQVRMCDRHAIPVAIRHRGDPDAGGVVLKLARGRDRCLVLRRVSDLDGSMNWMAISDATELSEIDAEDYLAREIKRDRDLWVLEIEDDRERYQLDGRILAR